MARMHTPEQIIRKLREIDRLLSARVEFPPLARRLV